MTFEVLPPDLTKGATLRGNEYGWAITTFPDALATAEGLGYACLGGQFQFRLDDGSTCEMYWLDAEPSERAEKESWPDYSRRSCREVLQRFQGLISSIDFNNEAARWKLPINLTANLVFVAYFVRETDWARDNLLKK